MAWQGVRGQDRLVAQLKRALMQGRLPSTFLFVGPPGVGKRLLAEKFAQALLCETADEADMAPCGRCPACQQAAAGTHPDLEIVSKPSDKSFIPIELFVGDREHRMREGLCRNIGLKPFRGGRKIAIIDDADFLNQEGANCLLKTLEEPPPKSVLILVATNEQRQLPTVRSRCQVLRFDPLAEVEIAELILEMGWVDDEETARQVASQSGGNLQRAQLLADPPTRQFQQQFLLRLGAPRFDSVELTKEVSAFVDEAGKDAAVRRARMRHVVGFAVDFYRDVLRTIEGLAPERDRADAPVVDAAAKKWPADASAAAACVERSLETLGHIDRNANQTSLLDCWLGDVARLVG